MPLSSIPQSEGRGVWHQLFLSICVSPPPFVCPYFITGTQHHIWWLECNNHRGSSDFPDVPWTSLWYLCEWLKVWPPDFQSISFKYLAKLKSWVSGCRHLLTPWFLQDIFKQWLEWNFLQKSIWISAFCLLALVCWHGVTYHRQSSHDSLGSCSLPRLVPPIFHASLGYTQL